MSDRTATTLLDDRATAAAHDLRAMAASRPVPEFDADALPLIALPLRPTPTSRSWPRIAAVAATVTLLAGTATWIALDGNDDGEVSSTENRIRPFAATAVPDDLALAGAADLGTDTEVSSPSSAIGPLSVYANADDEPTLGIIVLRDFGIDDIDDLDSLPGPPVEVAVGDADGYELGGSDASLHQLVVLTGSSAVLFMSPTVDTDGLVRVATGVAIDGDTAVLGSDALPPGWRHLGDEAHAETLISPLAFLRSVAVSARPGTAVVYLGRDQDRVLLVTSEPASDLSLAAVQVVAGTTEPRVVRGRPGLLGTDVGGQFALGESVRTVTWIESDGEVVRVAGLGLTEDEILEVANGVEPVDPDEWRELVRRTQLGDLESEIGNGEGGVVEVTEVARGTFADGTEWVLRAEGNGTDARPELDIALPAPDGSSSSSGSSSSTSEAGGALPPLYADVETSRGARRFAAGFVNDDVAHLVFLDATGAVFAEADPIDRAGYRGWVIEYVGTLVVVAQDADGREIARTEITADDSGSGSSPTPIVEGGG